MILRDTAAAGRTRPHVIRSVMVSVLAMTALLLGLFAVHSAGARHEMDMAIPAAAAHVEHATASAGASGAAGVGAVSVAVADVDGGWLSFGSEFMAGCGILAMTCSVLLIVVALIRLVRQPSVYKRLVDAGWFVVISFRTIPIRVHRPSLTLLCISRI